MRLINNALIKQYVYLQYDSIAKDKGFLRVLSKLKSKDPAIYDKEKTWFENEEGEYLNSWDV